MRQLVLLLLVGCVHRDRIRAQALADGLAADPDHYVVVDVRSDGEWNGKRGHVPGATHLAWPGIKERADEIEARADQEVVLVCFTGHRSRWAMDAVREAVPAPVVDLRGGMIAWWAKGLPVEVEPREAGIGPVASAPSPDTPGDTPTAASDASTSPEPAAPAGDTPPKREKLRWLVLPNLSYDSDDKLGFGARAEISQPEAGLDPYRSAFVVHLFATTNGYHHHRFRFDLVGLGPKQKSRMTGHFAFRAWLNDGYWGIGNGTVRETKYDGADADSPDAKRYRYSLIQPFGQVALRHEVMGPLSLYGSINVRYSLIDELPTSLLAEQAPVGMDGGLGVQLIGGALWDTRSPEVTPDRGWLLELSARGVTGDYTFGGPFASARSYVTLGKGVVLGERVMAEWLFGDIPFYEMVHWGGVVPIAGVGGADSLRGIAFGRWRAPAKAVSNTELRLDVLRHRALKQELRWQLVPFVDLGAVWGAGDAATAPPPEIPVHPAGGLGVRAIWAETVVGRLDAGISQDLTDEGPALGWGLYLMFDHMF